MKKFYFFTALLFASAVLMAQTTVFSDNFESGTSNWTLTNSWGLATSHYHSTSHSLTESPVGNYANNVTSYATMVTGVNLTTALSASVSFWAIYSIEAGFDYMYLQVSPNGGTTWNTVHSFDDTSSVWTQYTYSLGGYVGNSNVKIRFKFVSDAGLNFDGMYIDDLVITSSSTDNSPPLVLHTPRPYYEGRLSADSIIANIIDVSGVAVAEVIYSVDGGANDTIVATSINGNTYNFMIPSQVPGSMVDYHIYAKDSTATGNSINTPTYSYMAGKHIFYDAGVVDFVDSISSSTGAAMRMSLGTTPTTIAGLLIRNYTDVNRPNDSILVHVWSNSLGLPGTDIITPFKVFPAANLQQTSIMTVVDLRAYASQLSNLSGDVFIGYTVPSGVAWATITQPSTVSRSYKYNGTTWALASGTSGTSDFHFRVITTGAGIPPTPNFSFDATADPLVTFTNLSTNSVSYRWNFGDGTSFDTTTNTSHTFTHNGIFNVCLLATNSVQSDSLCKNVTISSYQAPVSIFTFDTVGDPTVQFTDASSNSPTNWYWDFDDNGTTSTVQNPSHTFPAIGGTFNVCLTASSVNGNGNNACNNVILSVGAGFDDNGQLKNIKIYPNPVKDNAVIEILNQNTSNVVVELFDMTGKQLSIDYSINKNGIILKRGALAPGNYIFRILNDKEVVYSGSLIMR